MSLNLDKSAWKRVTLGDVAFASKEKVDPSSGEVERYVAGEHMDSGDLRIHRWGEVGDGYLGPAFHRRFRPGQVLYGSRRTYLRKVAVAEFNGVTANTTFVVGTKDPSTLLQGFLPFVMSSEPFHAFAIRESKGSVNPYVNWSDIARYRFDLPPTDEQTRLADLLWALEADRRNHVSLVDKHVKVVQDFCHFLYDYCSKRFGSCSFADIGELRMGRQKAPKYMTGQYFTPYLRVVNIGALRLELEEVELMDFDESDLKKYRLQPGDILLTEGDLVSPMNVGRPALFSGEIQDCCFQNTLIRFRPSQDHIPEFYVGLFEGMRLAGVFASAASTTTVTHLGLKRLSAIRIPNVPFAVQQEFATKLAELLQVRSLLKSANVASANLRQRLIAEVFG